MRLRLPPCQFSKSVCYGWFVQQCSRVTSRPPRRRGLNAALLSVAIPLLLTLSVVQSADESADAASQRYEFREDHHRDGIGKFYMGREIAHVMGFFAAPWLERDNREEEERLTLLIRSLKLKPGDVVADIGAGSGVISMMMAERILPDGKVMAVDIQDEMLERLQKRCAAAGVTNVLSVKGGIKSPNLKPDSIDLAIMVDVYHEFEFPWEMMNQIAKAMKPGGRVVLVEYRMEDPAVPIKLLHKMSQAQTRKEVAQPEFHLQWKETIDALPRQHVIVFEKIVADEPARNPAGESTPNP
jgi:ubiquinone/menaquinone biosynthesis C-methylase UbiE